MLDSFFSIVKTAFGIGDGNFIPFVQMCLRGLGIYILSIILIRFNRRFAGVRTPFNFILFVTLGSISAAGITGAAPFLPVCGLIIFLIVFNRIIAGLVFFFPKFESLLKGSLVLLAKNGEIQWEHMRRNSITKRDLYSELRDQMQTDDLSSVDFAFLATDGEINFVKRKEDDNSTEEHEQNEIDKELKEEA